MTWDRAAPNVASLGKGYRFGMAFPAPAPALSINQAVRQHWATNRRNGSAWKGAAALYGRAMLRQHLDLRTLLDLPGPTLVGVTFTFQRTGRRDPHNYTSTTVKAIIDGLTTAGFWPDDTAEHVRVDDPVLEVAPAIRPACRIMLTNTTTR